MPDFSGASLKLKAVDEDKVLATLDRIDKKGREVVDKYSAISKSELDRASAFWEEHYGRVSKAARSTQQVVDDVSKKVETNLSHSAAIGLGEMARGFGRVAESGNLSAFAVREFTGAAFRLGGALGASGAGAAIGIATIAIGGLIEYFQRAGQKADEMGTKYQDALNRIAHASTLFQVSQDEQFAYSGDPLSRLVPKGAKESDIEYLKRTGGQLALAQEAMRVKALIAKSTDPNTSAGEAAELRAINLHGELTKRVQELDKAIGEEGMMMAVADQRRRQLNESEAAAAKARLDKKNLQLDSRSVGEYSNEELNRIVQRIKSSGDLTVALTNEHNDVVALRNEQALLRRELDQVNLSVAERISKEKELARVTKELEETSGTSIFMNGTNVRVNPKVSEKEKQDGYDKEQIDAIKRAAAKMKEEADRAGQQIAGALTNGIMSALKAGTIKQGFKALTESVLQGLGDMFAAIAEKALIASLFMQKITAFLVSNPWLAAAAAVAMLAFAKSLGGSGGGGGGGYSGGGGGSYGTVIDRGYINPGAPPGPVASPSSITAKPSVTNVNYIIGPADPVAQRMFDELSSRSAKRGSLG